MLDYCSREASTGGRYWKRYQMLTTSMHTASIELLERGLREASLYLFYDFLFVFSYKR